MKEGIISHAHMAPLLGCGVLLFLARVHGIAQFGSFLPSWDDWRIPQLVLLPWLEGTLSLADIFSPHNEHRIAVPRLIFLVLFTLNAGQWDIYVGLIFSTLVLCLAVFVAVRAGFSSTPLPLLVAAVFLWSTPNAWHSNALWYFEMQWYCFALLSIGSFCVLHTARYLWMLSILLALAAFFSVASPSPLIVLFLIFLISSIKGPLKRGNVAGMVLCFGSIYLCLWLGVPRSWGAVLTFVERLSSPKELYDLFFHWITGLSWPFIHFQSGRITFLLYTPFFLGLYLLSRRERYFSTGGRVGITIAGWVVIHTGLLCLVRGSAYAERYWEIPPFGVMGNLTILYDLWIQKRPVKRNSTLVLFTLTWVAVVGFGLGALWQIPTRRLHGTVIEDQARDFVRGRYRSGEPNPFPTVIPHHVYSETREAVTKLEPFTPFSWHFYTGENWNTVSLATLVGLFRAGTMGPLSFLAAILLKTTPYLLIGTLSLICVLMGFSARKEPNQKARG